MKMRFPALNTYGTALIIAVVLAVIGNFLYPLLALELNASHQFALGLGAGALIAVVLAALRFEAGPSISTADSDDFKSIFVGNLAYRASKEDLQQLFAQYGTVRSVRIMTDRMTRRPRGFGFVEMDPRGALAAIKALDGKEFHGRQLKVNEGNDRKSRESQAA